MSKMPMRVVGQVPEEDAHCQKCEHVESTLEDIAVLVHALLAVGNAGALGCHLLSRRRGPALFHGVVLAYDLLSMTRHWRDGRCLYKKGCPHADFCP